jgi:hypothetical protein
MIERVYVSSKLARLKRLCPRRTPLLGVRVSSSK